MKKYFLLLLIAAVSYARQPELALIPQPVEVKESHGVFLLTASSSIGYNDPAAQHVAVMLSGKLSVPTGYALNTQQGNGGTIQFVLNASHDAKLGQEGYTLVSTPERVVITANRPAGLFYGMQTLLQLLPKEIESKTVVKGDWTIPAVSITDYPRFPWRGIMLDVARNFYTKADVKTFIDQIAKFKYNTFQWHLTDDEGWRLEIKALPRLTSVGAWRVPRIGYFGQRAAPKPGEAATVGGFYTQADVKEVIAYAAERFITVIPDIDIPGHSMAALAAYPELSCTKDMSIRVSPGMHFADWYGNGTFKMFVDNTYNPSDENVYHFLDKVFTEVAAVFPSPYIHVGGDECYKGYWSNNDGCIALMKKLKIRHVEDLQGYFMDRINTILASKGKKMLAWDEILDGGSAPGVTVMSWRSVKTGIEASRLGHDVVMTP
ncbi:MAG TPA: beta-N-acetylhexosaminidase, partial [Bacteroidota bacterium]|nr:beta-N-acetylhexosaminidase [Bacteroidota bacterium]